MALLASVLLIGHVVGSYELTEVLATGDRLAGHELYPLILILFLLGAGTKSAQFPFHTRPANERDPSDRAYRQPSIQWGQTDSQ